jgi:hypothetical protein
MFRKAILATAITCVSLPALAEDTSSNKHFSAGIASFATTVRTDTRFGTEDDDFSGFALFGTGAVNDNVGFRLTYAKQSLEDDSDLKLDALEGSIIAGTGLATTGFKAYGSLGFFSETMKMNGFSNELDFSGLMLGGGIGYNWNPVSLEFWINFRDSGDYEDLIGEGADVAAASGGLGLSVRF